MIAWLNRLVAVVEEDLTEDLDVAALAARFGTTEHHLRRMFSALAGMPLSEYVRRRRMTVAAADVVAGTDDLLERRRPLRLRLGRGVRPGVPLGARRRPRPGPPRRRPPPHPAPHQVPPDRRRRDPHGRPHPHPPRLPPRRARRPRAPRARRGQPRHPAARGRDPRGRARAAQGPRRHRAVRPARRQHRPRPRPPGGHRADLPARCGPGGVHGCARTTSTSSTCPPGRGPCSGPAGPYPQTLQDVWAATATEWFPSNPWRLRPGPEIVAVLERADDFSTATVELWLPVEKA